jgi:hypothetical protein
MAVTKLWVVRDRLDKVIDYAKNPTKTEMPKYLNEDLQALKDVLDYAQDGKKTEKQFYVSGVNCNPDKARNQFVMVKQQYDKLDGIQAYHGYMSFKKDEATPQLAHEIGIEFAQRVWGERFQVVVATHLDTDNVHNHFVINSVSFVDGKRIHGKEQAWFIFKDVADDLCRKYDLSVNKNIERNRDPYYLTMLDKAGMPTRYNLAKSAIDEAISVSSNMKEFGRHLYELGYNYDLSPNRKYWTVTPKGSKKHIRLYRLGDDYTNVRIRERVIANRDNVIRGVDLTYKVPKPNDNYDVRKVKGSLYNLYLYYCYRLGVFDKPEEKQNPNRLHYLLREELMKVDLYSKEAQLLSKNQIDTAEQLLSYKESILSEMSTLTDNRTNLKNKIRQSGISDAEKLECKEKISLISTRLKDLRNEVKLCDDIGQRSHIVESNIECIVKDDEKIKHKEGRTNEQFRGSSRTSGSSIS